MSSKNFVEEIPDGVQSQTREVSCKGVRAPDRGDLRKRLELLDEPVTAEITTFSNGMRRVCCPNAVYNEHPGLVYCGNVTNAECYRAWRDPEHLS